MPRPEIAIYLKCPGFSRLLLLSWDNTVQLWLESLNHEFLALCCPFIATIKTLVRKEVQDDHTEHAQKATTNNKSPPLSPNFFVPNIFSLEVGTYVIIT